MTTIVAGNVAQGFSLKSLDNQTFSLQTLLKRGPVVVAFFKISCPVCQFTFPFLERLHQRYSSNAVSSTGFDKKDLETIAAALAERGKIGLIPLFRPEEVIPANKPG